MNVRTTIAYNYFFNYFGGDRYKDKVICGAAIDIAIIPFKDGKEVKFSKEPEAADIYLSDVLKVSFDRNKIIHIEKNWRVDNIFRILKHWEKIDYKIVGYSLDYYDAEETKKIQKELKECLGDAMPNELLNTPCSVSMEVTKEEFEIFLRTHSEDFDILDNKNAQVPSYSLIELSKYVNE